MHSRKIKESASGSAPKRTGEGSGKPGVRYASGYAHMLSIWERCGFTEYAPTTSRAKGKPCLDGNIRWTDLWKRVDAELSKIELWEKTNDERHTIAYFSWFPGGLRRGGMVEVNRRICADWGHPVFESEAHIWAIFDEVPKTSLVKIPQITERMAERLRAHSKEPLPAFELEIPCQSIAVIGGTAPYLALAIGSDNRAGNYMYAKPSMHRLLLYAVASSAFPVPVESSHERDVVLYLRDCQIPFVKPVFDDEDGLRPDFRLPDHKTVTEVQGMNMEEYRERKEKIHRRLMSSARYHGWRLMRYDPNEGERLGEFKKKLAAVIGHDLSVRTRLA